MLEFHEHQQEKCFTYNTVFLLLKSNSQTLMNIDEKYLPKCTNSGFFKAMLENCFQLS